MGLSCELWSWGWAFALGAQCSELNKPFGSRQRHWRQRMFHKRLAVSCGKNGDISEAGLHMKMDCRCFSAKHESMSVRHTHSLIRKCTCSAQSTHVHVHSQEHACANTSTHAQARTHMQTHTRAHTRTQKHTHTRTHIHTAASMCCRSASSTFISHAPVLGLAAFSAVSSCSTACSTALYAASPLCCCAA
jgi:hypothetical protein